MSDNPRPSLMIEIMLRLTKELNPNLFHDGNVKLRANENSLELKYGAFTLSVFEDLSANLTNLKKIDLYYTLPEELPQLVSDFSQIF